jgi:hypothetical protein
VERRGERMAGNSRKNGTGSAVIERALNAGLAQAALGREVEAEVMLTAAHEKAVTELCSVLGLSARSVLNAALRYALHSARARKVPPSRLKEFPRRLEGRVTSFALTAETLAQLRDAEVLDQLPACAVAGLTLLRDRLLKVKGVR